MDELGSYLCLYETDGSLWYVAPHEEPRIDAAVTQHIDSAGSRDSLLCLTALEGWDIKLRTSQIASWFVSTPEGRRANTQLQKLQHEEATAIRHDLGIWEDEA